MNGTRKVTPYQSASDSKYRGLTKWVAWDEYIQKTGLRPDIDASEFYAIFEKCDAAPLANHNLPVNFTPTHFDAFLEIDCMVTQKNGYKDIVWGDGHTGSEPDAIFSGERYIKK